MTTITTPTITMHAGGTGEREQAIHNIKVPDLWHVATRLREADNMTDAQMVMDCWHLAHAMKDHLQAAPEPDRASEALKLYYEQDAGAAIDYLRATE
jgi:hypothetical protein